jgi:hypothetical protein
MSSFRKFLQVFIAVFIISISQLAQAQDSTSPDIYSGVSAFGAVADGESRECTCANGKKGVQYLTKTCNRGSCRYVWSACQGCEDTASSDNSRECSCANGSKGVQYLTKTCNRGSCRYVWSACQGCTNDPKPPVSDPNNNSCTGEAKISCPATSTAYKACCIYGCKAGGGCIDCPGIWSCSNPGLGKCPAGQHCENKPNGPGKCPNSAQCFWDCPKIGSCDVNNGGCSIFQSCSIGKDSKNCDKIECSCERKQSPCDTENKCKASAHCVPGIDGETGCFSGHMECTCPTGKVPNGQNGCKCPDGQEEVNGTCVAVCTGGKIRNSSGNCVCPEESPEECGGKCIARCPSGVLRDPECNCAGCKPDFEPVGDKCLPPCKDDEIRDGEACVPKPCETGCKEQCSGGASCVPTNETDDRNCVVYKCSCPPGQDLDNVTKICKDQLCASSNDFKCPGSGMCCTKGELCADGSVPGSTVCVKECPQGTFPDGKKCKPCTDGQKNSPCDENPCGVNETCEDYQTAQGCFSADYECIPKPPSPVPSAPCADGDATSPCDRNPCQANEKCEDYPTIGGCYSPDYTCVALPSSPCTLEGYAQGLCGIAP